MEQNPILPGLRGLFTMRETSNARCVEVGPDKFVGEHFGFGATHSRRFTLAEDRVVIEDTLDIDRPSSTVLTLAPEVTPVLDSGHNRVHLLHSSGDTSLWVEPWPPERSISIVNGFCSESYGAFKDSYKLVVARITPTDSITIKLPRSAEGVC